MSRVTALDDLTRVAFAAALVFEISAGASRLIGQQVGFGVVDPSTALTLWREADQLSGDQRQRV